MQLRRRWYYKRQNNVTKRLDRWRKTHPLPKHLAKLSRYERLAWHMKNQERAIVEALAETINNE